MSTEKKNIVILSIETSCDETSAAIVKNGTELISHVVHSQIVSHKRFGGVVPEIASRHHVEMITYVIEKAIQDASTIGQRLMLLQLHKDLVLLALC